MMPSTNSLPQVRNISGSEGGNGGCQTRVAPKLGSQYFKVLYTVRRAKSVRLSLLASRHRQSVLRVRQIHTNIILCLNLNAQEWLNLAGCVPLNNEKHGCAYESRRPKKLAIARRWKAAQGGTRAKKR